LLIIKSVKNFSKNQKIALQNCRHVFPKYNNNKINCIVNKSWENLGKTIFELFRLNEIMKKKKNFIIEGKHIVDEIINSKSRAIFISIHQSNWEVCVPLLDKLGISVGAIYRHINNSLIDKFIFNRRTMSLKSNSSFYTPKGRKSAKDIIEGIKNNSSIFLLVDQKDSAGENISFFNKEVKTQIGFLKIARKNNIPIIPMQNIRLDNGIFKIIFHEPIYNSNENIADEMIMLQIHKIIEDWIKSNPTQWFWQHNRFS